MIEVVVALSPVSFRDRPTSLIQNRFDTDLPKSAEPRAVTVAGIPVPKPFGWQPYASIGQADTRHI